MGCLQNRYCASLMRSPMFLQFQKSLNYLRIQLNPKIQMYPKKRKIRMCLYYLKIQTNQMCLYYQKIQQNLRCLLLRKYRMNQKYL